MDNLKNRVQARPLKAIQLKCYGCSGWSSQEIGKCPHANCALYHLRGGKRPKGLKYVHITLAKYKQTIENL